MTSPTTFYRVIQIILHMYSCGQSLVTAAFLWQKLWQPQFDKDLTRKTTFFERWSWFKFNKLALARGTNLKFYTVGKGLKLKVKTFWGLIRTFVEVTGEKLAGGGGEVCAPSWIGLRPSNWINTSQSNEVKSVINCEKYRNRQTKGCFSY